MTLGLVLFLSGTGFGFILGAAVAIRMGKPSRTAPVEPVYQSGDSSYLRPRDLTDQWRRTLQ
jgi:hypothetical protein